MIGIMEPLLPMLVAAPLLIGGVLLAVPRQHLLRHILGAGTLAAMLIGAIALVIVTSDGTVLAHQIALWPGGVSIPFVADAFSSLILAVAAIMGAYCVLWGLRRVRFFYWFVVVFDYVRAPAIVLLPVVAGNPDFLVWIDEETGPLPEPRR